MIGIYIMKMRGVTPDDPRGNIWEWKKNGKQVTVLERKKGAIFGQHYHKGEDPSKDPEIFFLAHGRVRILFERSGEKSEEYFFDAGTIISIDPYIYHELEALEDCVFVEYRKTIFDPACPDTYRRE